MKFSDVNQGTFARRKVTLDLNGTPVELDVRVLNTNEEAAVVKGARAYAEEHGSPTPTDGDPAYQLGLWVHTAALACTDSTSPPNAPRPFFDGGVEQIRSSVVLTRLHLSYLYEHQALLQSEVSPYERVVDDESLMGRMYAIADGDPRPFVGLPPNMRWPFVRGLAARHVTLLAAKSLSGAPSSDDAESVEEPTH
jgi:hypothetical protein